MGEGGVGVTVGVSVGMRVWARVGGGVRLEVMWICVKQYGMTRRDVAT